MRLQSEVLNQSLAKMPQGPEHTTVWHLCDEDRHMLCAKEIGKLAEVTLEPPEIPNEREPGMFLMRLHPLVDQVHIDEGAASVWLLAARSFPHSTVWHETKPTA